MLEINNQTKIKLPSQKLQEIFAMFSKKYKFKTAVSLAIVGDAEIKKVNKKYRGIDKPTDVLSFDNLNEIIISLPQIKRQAKELDKKWEQELFFIFIHGLLHLVGYNDNTEKKRLEMIKLGEDFLRKYGIIRKSNVKTQKSEPQLKTRD
jgi:probable rRNA maturation factor